MISLSAVAHAKLNLTLDVLGRRSDGYHDLEMVMQEISLGDALELEIGTGEPWQMECSTGEIPCDDSNLCIKAARLFFAATQIDCGGLTVRLTKYTPSCAGMGGGSADGAAVLRLLWEHYDRPISREALFALAEQTGSDVPFTLLGGTALAREKGQVLTVLPKLPMCQLVICKPDFPISTPALFRAIDDADIVARPDTDGMLHALEQGDLAGIARRLSNVFTPVVARDHPEIAAIRDVMLSSGALGAEMTGSGPTVFGIFQDQSQAARCHTRLKARYRDTFLAHPV